MQTGMTKTTTTLDAKTRTDATDDLRLAGLTHRRYGYSPFGRRFTCCDALRPRPLLRDYFRHRERTGVVAMRGGQQTKPTGGDL